MKSLITITLLLATVLVCTPLARGNEDLTPVNALPLRGEQPVALLKDGQPLATIVLPNPKLGSRKAAAAIKDLTSLLERSTGAAWPTSDQRPAEGPAIVLGVAGDGQDKALEGFTVFTEDNALHIIGNDSAGLAHGIYDVLERVVGVRFYWPTYKNDFADSGTFIPQHDDLVVQPTHYSDAPAFRKRIRWPSGGPRIGDAHMSDHDRRLRSGNTWPNELIVHAPFGWHKTYKDSRPEIFQLRADGERDWTMLCYGHPLTLKTYLEQVEAQHEPDSPLESAGRVLRGKAVTVSPADLVVNCECEYCQALWNDEGGVYGTASNILGRFVASLGRELEERWPELEVVYLPYKNYTQAPEGIEFPSNVEVQLCGMPGMAMYAQPEVNASEQANIDKWVELTGRPIQNWHYSCWPANRTDAAYLFPNTVKAHYLANRDKTVGTFINGVSDHWPRQHLSLYVWLKVLWNPEIDVDAVVAGYVERMYGNAAAPMEQIVTKLIEGWEDTKWDKPTLSPVTVYEESYPRETVLEIQALLAEAYELAKGDPLVTRRLDYYAPSLQAFFDESKLVSSGEGIKPMDLFQAGADPILDGKLDDAAWEGAKPVQLVKASGPKANQAAAYPTEVRAVWTPRGVTFGFNMQEPNMQDLQRDIDASSRNASNIWWNDNVEIFLDPTGERTKYYTFIINANGASWTSIGRENTTWSAEGMEIGTHVGDDHWAVEVFIPYDAFEDALAPGTGTTWYGNFTRHRVNNRKPHEYQGFNVTSGQPSHNQNAFGPFRFIER